MGARFREESKHGSVLGVRSVLGFGVGECALRRACRLANRYALDELGDTGRVSRPKPVGISARPAEKRPPCFSTPRAQNLTRTIGQER